MTEKKKVSSFRERLEQSKIRERIDEEIEERKGILNSLQPPSPAPELEKKKFSFEEDLTAQKFAIFVRQKLALENLWEFLKWRDYRNEKRKRDDKIVNLNMLIRAWIDIILEVMKQVNLKGAFTEEEMKKRIIEALRTHFTK